MVATYPVAIQTEGPGAGWRERIAKALEHHTRKNRMYDKYHKYVDGDQPLTFATSKFRGAFGNLFREFADNICPKVVNSAADRLQVTGFDLGDAPDDEAELMQQIYDDCMFDTVIGDTMQESLTAGDAYIIVWPDPLDPTMPLVDPQPAEQMCVYYNEENPRVKDWASKLWRTDDKHYRMNLYYPDRLEKFITVSGGLSSFPTSRTSWRPLDGEAVVANPYGVVTVFHFPNNPGLRQFGRSELHNVIPLQDALNKTIADMMVAMEFVAMPQRYATGIEVMMDNNGKVIPPWDIGIDRILAVADKDVKFGQFAQADVMQFIHIQNDIRQEAALISDTPVHYFVKEGAAGFPSGESLKTAEASFVAKCVDRQKRATPELIRLGKLAYQIRTGITYEGQMDPIWSSASPRSDKEVAENAILKKTVGVPDEQLWQEMGYDQDQIGEFKDIKQENMRTFGASLLAPPGDGAGQNEEQFSNA